MLTDLTFDYNQEYKCYSCYKKPALKFSVFNTTIYWIRCDHHFLFIAKKVFLYSDTEVDIIKSYYKSIVYEINKPLLELTLLEDDGE